MNTIQINSGEFIGMKILLIKSIPHISVLSDNVEQEEHIKQYARDMSNLLSEIYQQYKEMYKQMGQNPDISIELNWITEAVSNQPYKAKINLYLIIRNICKDQQEGERTL